MKTEREENTQTLVDLSFSHEENRDDFNHLLENIFLLFAFSVMLGEFAFFISLHNH